MSQENLQHGVQLTFYCHLRTQHAGMLLPEWLLEQAKRHGLGGGSVFRAIAGLGRHGVLHEEQFELADDLPVRSNFCCATSRPNCCCNWCAQPESTRRMRVRRQTLRRSAAIDGTTIPQRDDI